MFKSQAQINLQPGTEGSPQHFSNNMDQGNGSGSGGEMPSMPGGGGMPAGGMFMQGGPGGMPNDARLADEFMKLQQDFFKWQQQLLQNQHLLHSRVAPLASNPPQLQSVGVLRDIMSQGPSTTNGAPEVVEARNPVVEKRGPVERIINIRFEDGPSESDDSQVHTQPLPRLNQGMDQVTSDMSRLNTANNNQPRRWGGEPNVSVGAWMERPTQPPVGVYQDRDYSTSAAPRMQPSPQPSVVSPPVMEGPQRYSPPRSATTMGPQGYSRPVESASAEPYKSFQWAPPQQQQQFSQPMQQIPQTLPQQYHSLPPEQQQQFAQFLQQQQPQPQQTWPPSQPVQQHQQPQQKWQPQPPQQQVRWSPPQQQPEPSPQPQFVQPPQQQDRAAFWQQGQGVQGNQEASEPTRPPRRNSRHDSPPQDDDGVQLVERVVVHEPPPTYYYNGNGSHAPVPRSKEPQTEVVGGGPRYTSVVTVSSDKNEQPNGAPKDKVRSVVQLNSEQQQQQQRGMPRVAPVVRGFRQPGEEPQVQGPVHSRIVSGAVKGSQPWGRSSVSPPSEKGSLPTALSGPAPQAPTAARLVAAVSQPAPKTPSPTPTMTRISPPRISPPQSSPIRTSPPQVSPSHTSPSRTSPARTSPPSRVSPPAGPSFPNVQLRHVPTGIRASPPPEATVSTPPEPSYVPYSPSAAPPTPPSAASMPAPPAPPMAPPAPPMAPPAPPMAPPAPPMAPPPPPMAPPPPSADGERRTASGKRIVTAKGGPELDAREELMMAIRNHGGRGSLRRTHNTPGMQS